MRTIRDAIDGQADARADAPFLLAPEPGAIVTYGALRDTAWGLGAELAAHGISAGLRQLDVEPVPPRDAAMGSPGIRGDDRYEDREEASGMRI